MSFNISSSKARNFKKAPVPSLPGASSSSKALRSAGSGGATFVARVAAAAHASESELEGIAGHPLAITLTSTSCGLGLKLEDHCAGGTACGCSGNSEGAPIAPSCNACKGVHVGKKPRSWKTP
eukprot:973020-Amphidinium_carterae.1